LGELAVQELDVRHELVGALRDRRGVDELALHHLLRAGLDCEPERRSSAGLDDEPRIPVVQAERVRGLAHAGVIDALVAAKHLLLDLKLEPRRVGVALRLI
jgi:hypothetical protein